MKISVSVPDEDVEFLDAYSREHGHASRSAAVQRAIAMLRTGQLDEAYEDAWSSWNSSEDADLWDAATGDGVGSR